MQATPLLPHDTTPDDALSSISVEVDSPTSDLLVLYFRVAGDIDRVTLPPQAASKAQDQLWKHTCFEAFISLPDSEAYFEFNFSPSSQWAAYRFDDYRQGMQPVILTPPPRVICRRRDGELDIDVDLHLENVPEISDAITNGRELRLAVSAVIEGEQGLFSFWALAHPQGKPDFHHRDGFALVLAGDPS
ncbi:MAG: DOMON-like domain-containing protein [Steroidobacter sp.]